MMAGCRWWSGASSDDAYMNYQNVSLRMRFALDAERVMEARRRGMLKYDFQYNKWDVDRRRNLSLEEFRDVYDGKWFAFCKACYCLE